MPAASAMRLPAQGRLWANLEVQVGERSIGDAWHDLSEPEREALERMVSRAPYIRLTPESAHAQLLEDDSPRMSVLVERLQFKPRASVLREPQEERVSLEHPDTLTKSNRRLVDVAVGDESGPLRSLFDPLWALFDCVTIIDPGFRDPNANGIIMQRAVDAGMSKVRILCDTSPVSAHSDVAAGEACETAGSGRTGPDVLTETRDRILSKWNKIAANTSTKLDLTVLRHGSHPVHDRVIAFQSARAGADIELVFAAGGPLQRLLATTPSVKESRTTFVAVLPPGALCQFEAAWSKGPVDKKLTYQS